MAEPGQGDSTPESDPQQAVRELVAKPGVKDAVQSIVKEYEALPGRNQISGMTTEGLFIIVRENLGGDASESGYFKATAFDTSKPIEEGRVDARFSYSDVDRWRDGGTTIFPGSFGGAWLAQAKDISEDQARQNFTQDQFSTWKFYKATEGFSWPSRLASPNGLPSVGKGIVYPLPQL